MNIYLREVSRHLGQIGVGVDVFTRSQDAECRAVEPLGENARVVHIGAGPPWYLPKERVVGHLPEFICNMREFIANEGTHYDLVHSHYWLSGRVAGYFKNAWRVPMVAMFHTLAELKNQVNGSADEQEGDARVAIERLTVAAADQVIASTPVDRGHLETYYGADESRVRVVPCGVDLERFSPGSTAAARRQLGLGDERVILFVGRIQQLKGIDIIVRAAASLAERNRAGKLPPFKILIVGGRAGGEGDDPESREVRRLRSLAHDLGVESYVRWVGALEHEELPTYYRAADVTVMPSTYESFGLVAVESMACGTPVVAARVGGLKTTIIDGQTGFLIGPREPAAYAARLGELLCDDDLRHQMGHAARARASLFGWNQVAGQLVELYDSLIRTRSTRAEPVSLLAS